MKVENTVTVIDRGDGQTRINPYQDLLVSVGRYGELKWRGTNPPKKRRLVIGIGDSGVVVTYPKESMFDGYQWQCVQKIREIAGRDNFIDQFFNGYVTRINIGCGRLPIEREVGIFVQNPSDQLRLAGETGDKIMQLLHAKRLLLIQAL